MKALLNVVPALAPSSGRYRFARPRPDFARRGVRGQMPMKSKRLVPHGITSGSMMHEGKMMPLKNAKLLSMATDMAMSNGIEVTISGNLMMAGSK